MAVEIVGGKATLFSPTGPLDVDDLELVTTVGESLPLDQLLPDKPVKVGESWKISDDTMALLLGVEEITSNSAEMVLNEVTPEFARFDLAGQVEGRLYGAGNQISLKAKCRFDRRTGRIDWFAMRLKQSREIGVVEDGLDATVLVQVKITRLETAEKLSDAALADLSLKPTDDLTLVRYLLSGGRMPVDARSFLVPDGSDPRSRRVPPSGSRPGHRPMQDIAAASSRPVETAHPRTIPGHRAESRWARILASSWNYPRRSPRPTCEFCG